MKTLEEFTQFYKSKLKARLIELDKKRIGIKHRIITVAAFMVAGAITFIIVSEYSNFAWYEFFDDRSAAVLFGSFGLFVILFIYGMIIYYPYKLKFKAEIVKEIISFLGYPLAYDPTGNIDHAMVEMSGLFPSNIKLPYTEDLISGEIEGFKFSFAELSIRLPEEKHRDTKLPDSYNGVFLMAYSGKETKEPIKVTDKMFGSIVIDPRTYFIPDHEPLTEVDEKLFRERFLVYSSDDEWKQILAEPFRLWLTNFRLKRRVQVSFIKDKIFATFTFDRNKNTDMFEPSLFKPADNFESLKQILGHLLIVLSFADALRKNSL